MGIFFVKDEGVKVRRGLVEVTVSRNVLSAGLLRQVCQLVEADADEVLTFTQGHNEITMITEKKYERKLVKLFEPSRVVKRIDSLSSLSIALPEQAYETQGLLYTALKALNDARINVVEILSTLTELTVMVDEEDTEMAEKALERMLEGN